MDEDRDSREQNTGEALSGPERSLAWVRETQRALGDVRVHDTSQAGELARRLGARAFTMGRDVYVRPELVKPMTHRGAALMAHELSHVAEQSGRKRPDVPLLRSRQARSTGPLRTASSRQLPVQRQEDVAPSAPAGSAGSEAAAQETETALLKAGTSSQPEAAEAQVDAEELADRVYELMVQEIILSKERSSLP